MSPNLLFLFVFQSGLAFAFSFFITSVMTKEAQGKTYILKFRNWMIFTAFLLSGFAYIIYYKSLPEGASISTAFWPSVWIFMILISISIGITVGYHRVKVSQS